MSKKLRIRSLGNGDLRVYCERLHRDEDIEKHCYACSHMKRINFDYLECKYVREERGTQTASL